MSDRRTPTIQQLLKSLKKLDNWLLFGVMLGVPVPKLKNIKSSHHQSDIELCKVDMLQYWLDNKLVSDWNEVIRALEETDQLALASQIKHEYLLSAAVNVDEGVSSKPTSPVIPPSSASATTDEIKADMTVVSNLKELEASFSHMVVKVKRLLVLNKCDLSDALLFLDSFIGTEDFIRCDNFDKLMRQLQRDHIGVFNISILQQLMACFNNHELTEVIEAYNEKKDSFLKQTTVLEFQRAVVSRVEPILASGKAVVTITISKEMASHRTLKDIENLAMEGFEECHKKFIHLHAEPGSIIISWVFPKGLSDRLKQLARDNAAVFEDIGVVEVTVGGRRVFPCTQQEDIPTALQEWQQLETDIERLTSDKTDLLTRLQCCEENLKAANELSTMREKVNSCMMAAACRRETDVEKREERISHLKEELKTANELLTMREKVISGMITLARKRDTDVEKREERMISYLKEQNQQLIREMEQLTREKEWIERDLQLKTEESQQVMKKKNQLEKDPIRNVVHVTFMLQAIPCML